MEPEGSLPHLEVPATCSILSHDPQYYFLKIQITCDTYDIFIGHLRRLVAVRIIA
jgi:hypothetical protein